MGSQCMGGTVQRLADWPKPARFSPRSRRVRARNEKGHECPFTVLAARPCSCLRVPWRVHSTCLRVPCPCLRVRGACAYVLAMFFLLPYSWIRCSAPERSLDGGHVQGSVSTLTGTSSSVASNGGVILRESSDRSWCRSDHTSKAIASTHNGICLHSKRHLPPHQTRFPTQPKAYAHALKGICPHNQTHVPPGKSPLSVAKSQKK